MTDMAQFLRQTSATCIVEYDDVSLDKLRAAAQQKLVSADLFAKVVEALSPQAGPGLALETANSSANLGIFPRTATFRVNFYESYALPAGRADCYSYVRKKFGAAVDVLLSVTKIRFLGVIYDSVLSNNLVGQDVASLGMNRFGLFQGLVAGGQPYDFVGRMSYDIDEKYFASVLAEVYEHREFRQLVQPNISIPLNVPLHQTRLADRGIRFAIDVNSKRWAQRENPDLGVNDWQRCLDLNAEIAANGLNQLILRIGSQTNAD